MAVVISLSGGLDSTTLLSFYHNAQEDVLAVNFFYSSKHGIREGIAAERVAEYYKIKLIKLNVSKLFATQHTVSTLMSKGGAVPEGHYTDSTMKYTIVPGRNTIFTAILAGIAESLNYSHVALAIHSGDHYIYPDCRPEWFNSMHQTIHYSTEGRVGLRAPFLSKTKSEIVKLGLSLNTPYHLTYTCYKGGPQHCGKCGSCVERLEAFGLNNIKDPVEYEKTS